ncbi:MAG: hypothetical protein LBT39_09345 [Treponema sp.]|nr:hypothetical protein [Treponema sp.]
MTLALAACASVPKTADALFTEKLPLESGAAVYLFADVEESRPVLDQIQIEGFGSADTAMILDRTRYAAAALFPAESGRGIQAVAWGDYPNVVAGFGLTPKRGWEKQRSKTGKSYWYSVERGLSLGLSKTQAFVARTTGAPTPLDPYTQGAGVDVPEGFTQFRSDSCLAFWMDEPAEPLARFFSGLRLPIQIPAEELMAGLVALPPAAEAAEAGPEEAETLYEIKMRIKTPSAANARSLVTLFTAARLFIPRGQGADSETFALLSLLFARPPQQEGVYLNLRTGPIDERGIALLFRLFSVYSMQN